MNKIFHCAVLSFFAGATSLVFAEQQTASQPLTVSAAAVQNVLATPTVEASKQGGKTVLVSPRTGIRYSFNNPDNRQIIFKTEGVLPVSAQNVSRIAASNPALSAQSQQQAEQALLDLAGIQAPQQPTALEAQTALAE
ncbi:hypothetical protein GCM10023206_28100 [Acinetobacter puyangensis]|uniref:Uncharacterized protein n=1 Tax=Acinetobacter puyangensis TaxID=1096779 RepID=A0A240E4G7_9GAMM|nr:hypothetical protein [Acinetobacter puyangensis]SNX43421.1 hypothetical protein SAMN05421731_101458 [Acinetobacter puyangensis]